MELQHEAQAARRAQNCSEVPNKRRYVSLHLKKSPERSPARTAPVVENLYAVLSVVLSAARVVSSLW